MARKARGRAVHGILLLDKPGGMSSNRALQTVKRLYGAKKAGHTGTLDPLATGMLPLCFGEATKLAAWLIDAEKGYETTLALGVTTDTADADGTVIERRAPPAALDRATLEALCRELEGPRMQVPPMVSAIKVDGQRLYRLAREGREVERAARPITIHALEPLGFDGAKLALRLRCSKGTYVRALATEIGERLGCGAHVASLRRTFVAPFEGAQTITLDALERLAAEGGSEEGARAALDASLLPPDAGLGHLPELRLDAASAARFARGQSVALPLEALARAALGPSAAEPDASAPWRVREPSGRLVGLGALSADGRRLAPRRVLVWE